MLSYNYSSKILNGFFGRNVEDYRDAVGELIYKDTPIQMDEEGRHIYIGLFVEMPNYNGDGGKEPGYEKSQGVWEVYPEYSRIQLDCRSRFDKKAEILSLATSDGTTVSVTSQEMIIFPEAIGKDTDGWGDIAGFGLYYGKTSKDEESDLFLWGTIEDENGKPIKIAQYQVPVIRKGGLNISLK